MKAQYLTDCTLLLPDDTISNGSLLIQDESIAEICPESISQPVSEVNLNGCVLMAGMIDLHSDAIESMAEPRSGIYLPFELAAAQADQTAAANGITTFYNAISFAGEELGLRNGDAPARLVQAVNEFQAIAATDQRVHCRYEVTVDHALPKILEFVDSGQCGFVSYMDHSPGQGQFQDEANYRSYMTARYGYSEETITELLEAKMTEGNDPIAKSSRIRQLADAAINARIPFAGHDADSREHVLEMVELGATLAEFPMSEAAAAAGVEQGLHQSVGSVNVIRGGSQRTGMSAQKLIGNGQADCLCSDYVPATLLPAVLKMAKELPQPLHEIAKVVSTNPAKAAGLEDRGAIKPGLLADLCVFERPQSPLRPARVVRTWRQGKLIYSRPISSSD